jgi:hypothetical protein
VDKSKADIMASAILHLGIRNLMELFRKALWASFVFSKQLEDQCGEILQQTVHLRITFTWIQADVREMAVEYTTIVYKHMIESSSNVAMGHIAHVPSLL